MRKFVIIASSAIVTIFSTAGCAETERTRPLLAARGGGPTWVKYDPQFDLRRAIQAGQAQNEPLYICRAPHANGIHPGKVFGGACNIGFAGKEVVLKDFEILAGDPSGVRWIPTQGGAVPPGVRLVQGGHAPDGAQLVVCRAAHQGGLHPGKLYQQNCNIGFGGKEIVLNQYEVLAHS